MRTRAAQIVAMRFCQSTQCTADPSRQVMPVL
jgi:hypothetical protein